METTVDKITKIRFAYSMLPGAATADERGIWFCHLQLPFIYYYDYSECKVTVVKEVPTQFGCVFGESFAADVVKINSKLYVAPYYSRCLFSYDVLTDTFDSLLIVEKPMTFRKIVYYKDELVLFPCRYNQLIKYNIKTGEILYEKLPFEKEDIYISGVKRASDSVYCAMYNSGVVWRYNLTSNKWDSICIKGAKGFNRMSAFDDRIYLHDYFEDKLMCVQWGNEESPIIFGSYSGNTCAYAFSESSILINSEKSGKMMLSDPDFHIIKQIDFDYPYTLSNGDDHALYEISHEEESETKRILCDHHILLNVLDDGSIKWNYLQFERNQKKQIIKACCKNHITKENGLFSLEGFCESI